MKDDLVAELSQERDALAARTTAAPPTPRSQLDALDLDMMLSILSPGKPSPSATRPPRRAFPRNASARRTAPAPAAAPASAFPGVVPIPLHTPTRLVVAVLTIALMLMCRVVSCRMQHNRQACAQCQ